jgi:hypothetical protein
MTLLEKVSGSKAPLWSAVAGRVCSGGRIEPMRRTLIVLLMAVAAVVVLLLAMSEMTRRGPIRAAPLAQATETEPNGSCSQANEIDLAVPVQGAVDSITDTDYFSVPTQSGQPYIASASVGPADFKVRLCIYAVSYGDTCAYMFCSAASKSYVEKSFDATDDHHYVKIEKYDAVTGTTKTASYVLEVVEEETTPTPSPTPSPIPGDAYEPNNSFGEAYTLPVAASVTLENLSLLPLGDEDWFAFYVEAGQHYQAATSNLVDVDTYLKVFDRDFNLVVGDDDSGGGLASRADWQASYDGYYYVRVTNFVAGCGEYDLTVEEYPTPTPSPTPTPPLSVTVIAIDPPSAQVGVSGTTQVDIRIENVTNLDYVDVLVTFNPAVLEVVDADSDESGVQVKPGTFFGSDSTILDVSVQGDFPIEF